MDKFYFCAPLGGRQAGRGQRGDVRVQSSEVRAANASVLPTMHMAAHFLQFYARIELSAESQSEDNAVPCPGARPGERGCVGEVGRAANAGVNPHCTALNAGANPLSASHPL